MPDDCWLEHRYHNSTTVMNLLRPTATFESIDLDAANVLLEKFGHKMGILHRSNQPAICHALYHGDNPVAVTCANTTIRPNVAGNLGLTRDNTIELSRLCAARPGLCRVALRLWREFVFPALGYKYAISYQDADLHNGNIYRFDGWQRAVRSRSGTDQRTGKRGRDKWIWVWPPLPKPTGKGIKLVLSEMEIPELPEGYVVKYESGYPLKTVCSDGKVFLIVLDPPRLVPHLGGNRYDFDHPIIISTPESLSPGDSVAQKP